MHKVELEWKAEYVHNTWMATVAKQGGHHPDWHRRDIYQVHRLRGDGQTYCDKCHLSMKPYAMLMEAVKQYDRDLIIAAARCVQAWEESKGGRILPDLEDSLQEFTASLPKQAKPVAK